jgi:hypothetical protein
MMTLEVPLSHALNGGTPRPDLMHRFKSYDRIRQIERASIRAFMEAQRGYLRGRVLDFGAGEEPYRDLVTGEYVPLNRGGNDYDLQAPFTTIMCNQVLQYVDDPKFVLWKFAEWLQEGGYVVLTYPTNWDEVEASDLWRFTKSGMERLLKAAGFSLLLHERRAEVAFGGFKFPLGYGCVAQKN